MIMMIKIIIVVVVVVTNQIAEYYYYYFFDISKDLIIKLRSNNLKTAWMKDPKSLRTEITKLQIIK